MKLCHDSIHTERSYCDWILTIMLNFIPPSLETPFRYQKGTSKGKKYLANPKK